MRGRAGFHADQARAHRRKEGDDLGPPKPLSKNDSSDVVNPVEPGHLRSGGRGMVLIRICTALLV
jgi:hypothetical protein